MQHTLEGVILTYILEGIEGYCCALDPADAGWKTRNIASVNGGSPEVGR